MVERTRARNMADVAMAALVLMVVGMMIVPLPTPLLDVLIAANVSLAVLMMLVAMFITGGLEFTAFPTVLLITTLYRLALNVSSTRLILLNADGGDVIEAFGNFVVQGNYVVGAVVFLILTLIQFLVIAKGSERVAEVGARFTLDAMPGKQMSIDAEMRSGGLNQEQAKLKRENLQRESQFYGAMDGAMKFVKGDAIAGIVITLINVLGGLVIGITMKDMSAGEALKTFGLLTIGDGLVSQIPALLISTSAGLVVTRVASGEEDGSLGSDVASQVFGNPRPLIIAGVFLMILGVLPGLPALPFIILALVFFGTAYRLKKAPKVTPAPAQVVAKQEAARETKARRQMVPLVVPVAVDLGSALSAIVTDGAGGGELLEEEVPLLRDELFLDLGIALPGVRVRESSALSGDEYLVSMQEVPVEGGEVSAERFMALDSPGMLESIGVRGGESAEDPDGGLVTTWVSKDDAEAVEAAGIPALSPAAVVARHLGKVVRRRAQSLVGLQEVQSMLDQLERAYPALVRNVVPKPVSLALLTDVLRRLVDEGISIRPLREILEALATYAPNERDPVTLTELVRASLRRNITHKHSLDGTLAVYLLDSMIEDVVRDSIQRSTSGSFLALPPDMAKDILRAIKEECSDGAAIVLTQADIRRFLRRLVEVEMPDLTVLSYQELAPEVNVQPLARVTI